MAVSVHALVPSTAAAVVAAAVVVASLSGCSAASGPKDDADAIAAAVAAIPADLSSVRGTDLPLDRSLLTPVEEQEVIRARNVLMQRCLADHGLTHTFPAVDPVRDAVRPRRHGLVDPAQATTLGYRDPAATSTRAVGPADPPPTPEAVALLTGTRNGEVGGRPVPPGGCAGQADRTLVDDAQPGQEPTSFALSLRSLEIAGTTAPVTAAAAAWSRCMAEEGFDYPAPDAAIADPAFSAGPASAREIAVATRDVICKERVQWVRTWVAVERAIQDVLIQQHAADIDREQRHKERQLSAARRISR